MRRAGLLTANQPSSLWQSDSTHWNTEEAAAEIIGWRGNPSQFLLHLSAYRRVTGGLGRTRSPGHHALRPSPFNVD